MLQSPIFMGSMSLLVLATSLSLSMLATASENKITMVDLGKYGMVEQNRGGMEKLCALVYDIGRDYFERLGEDGTKQLYDDSLKLWNIKTTIEPNKPCPQEIEDAFAIKPDRYPSLDVRLAKLDEKCRLEAESEIYCAKTEEFKKQTTPDKIEALNRLQSLLCSEYEELFADRRRFGAHMVDSDCKPKAVRKARMRAHEEAAILENLEARAKLFEQSKPDPDEMVRKELEQAQARVRDVESRLEALRKKRGPSFMDQLASWSCIAKRH